MNVQDLLISTLSVSDVNVRKTLAGDEDEASITDLSKDIDANGLLNPLTVRLIEDDKYEVIAGQRRLMALRLLGRKEAPCNIVIVDNQKAEELSLVENVQRNQMTSCDKVRAYSRLYDVYDKDINKVISAVHITKATIQKYIKIKCLPEEIIERLDKTGDEKITLDVAVELCKIDGTQNNLVSICDTIQTLNTSAKINAIKTFIHEGGKVSIESIVADIVIEQNNIDLDPSPSFPFVIDEEGKYVIIPPSFYPRIISMIKNNEEE